MRRLGAIMPTGHIPRKRPTLLPKDRTGPFIITNGNPQPVNRIQVQSTTGEEDPPRDNPFPPAGNSRGNELPLLGRLQQQAQDEQGNAHPQVAGEEPPNANDMNTPTNSGGVADGALHGEGQHGSGHEQQQPGGLEQLPIQSREGNEHPRDRLRLLNSRKSKPPAKIELQCIPKFLKTHFDIMYYCGISPINGNGEWGSTAHTVAFTLVTIISMLSTFSRCKIFIIEQATAKDLQDYITAWYFISSLVLQAGLLQLVVISQSKVSTLLQDARTEIPGIRYKTSNHNVSWLAVIIFCMGIAFALVETTKLSHLLSGLYQSAEHVVLGHSHETSMLLYLWSKETNGTNNCYALFEQYGENMSRSALVMGICGMVMTFIGTVQEIAIKDVLLMSALHTFRLSKICQYNMMQACDSSSADDQLTELLQNIHERLHEMASDVESIFGSYFKLVHADNLLYCSYFLASLLGGTADTVYVFNGVISLLKITCILYFPTRAIELSQTVRGAIRKKFCSPNCLGNVDFKYVILLLQILEECPIAMGCGNFLVDETFALKFIGAVVTSFLFLMETDKEKMQQRRRR